MDEKVFEELIKNTGEIVLRAIGQLLREEEKDYIDDIAQETWVRVFWALKKNKIPEGEGKKAYICKIAQNETIRYLKKQKKEVQKKEKLTKNLTKSETNFSEANLLPLENMPFLSQRHRQILKHKLMGFKEKEIAHQLQIPIGSVKSALFRIREKLSRYYGGKKNDLVG